MARIPDHEIERLKREVASETGKAVGYGVGGSLGLGYRHFGFNLSGSQQLVVAPDGTAGIATSYTKQVFGVASSGTGPLVDNGIMPATVTNQPVSRFCGFPFALHNTRFAIPGPRRHGHSDRSKRLRPERPKLELCTQRYRERCTGVDVHHRGVPVLLSPYLTAARHEIPDFLNRSMNDSL